MTNEAPQLPQVQTGNGSSSSSNSSSDVIWARKLPSEFQTIKLKFCSRVVRKNDWQIPCVKGEGIVKYLKEFYKIFDVLFSTNSSSSVAQHALSYYFTTLKCSAVAGRLIS